MQNFTGKDGFNWWTGVVENNADPLNLGRVQVRIFGWHTANKMLIPTSDLPWALPVNSPNSSMSAAVPLVGDWCFGFFCDGMSGQAPILIGVFPGIVQGIKNEQVGFSEGDFYPQGEPTTSRLYRNEKIGETPVGYHDANLDTGVPTADGSSWSEPKSQYATKPPYNRVTQTVAGHVFELDDTPGAERIHLGHKKEGLTFFEIAPDGSKVTKVQGKNYEIYLSDNNIHVKGACNITVDGNATLYVKGNVTEEVDGNVERTIKGNLTETIDGTVNRTVNGSVTESFNSSYTNNTGSTYDVTAGGDMTLIAPNINLNP